MMRREKKRKGTRKDGETMPPVRKRCGTLKGHPRPSADVCAKTVTTAAGTCAEESASTSVFGTEDLVLLIASKVRDEQSLRSLRALTRACFAVLRVRAPAFSRRRVLERWLKSHSERWKTVGDVMTCAAAKGVCRRYVSLSYTTSPRGGLRAVAARMEEVEEGARASCDAELFLHHLGTRLLLRGISARSLDQEEMEGEVRRAEERTRDSLERRRLVEPHLPSLLPEVREACAAMFVRGQEYLSFRVAGDHFCERALSVSDVIAVDAKAKRACRRKEELANALLRVQCPRRPDSRLCSNYLHGRTRMTADQVAHKVAHARWLHEYMRGAYRQAVENAVEDLARGEGDSDDSEDEGGFYSGIYADAVRIVQGRREFAPPGRWPWMTI